MDGFVPRFFRRVFLSVSTPFSPPLLLFSLPLPTCYITLFFLLSLFFSFRFHPPLLLISADDFSLLFFSFFFFFLWKAIKLVEVGVLEHLFFFLEFRTFRWTPIPPSISVRNSLISLPFSLNRATNNTPRFVFYDFFFTTSFPPLFADFLQFSCFLKRRKRRTKSRSSSGSSRRRRRRERRTRIRRRNRAKGKRKTEESRGIGSPPLPDRSGPLFSPPSSRLLGTIVAQYP